MRIISQNRNYSINFDSTHIWKQYEYIYAHVDSGKDIVIGHYETDERASEVFMDIHNAYAPVGIVATNLSEEQIKAFIGSENISMNVIRLENQDYEVTTFENYVYLMPEK